ncbi:MAG: DUF2288 family protein [Sandaracinaceae bacterium]|nr:DUF2288 family protein [Sandaracinaceae bacterium]
MSEPPDEPALRQALEAGVGPVFFSDLAAHIRRGGLFVVEPELPLVDAALAIALNDTRTVSAWLDAGRLRRPTEEEPTAWAAQEGLTFDAVVVQPFVLIALR